MKEMESFFGKLAQDDISGFQGVITGAISYKSGLKEYLLQPLVKDDGSFNEPVWVTVDRVVIVEQ